MSVAEFAEDPTRDLPRAHGGPVLEGCLRARPEDFAVDEDLGFGPSGEGEHVWLRLRKRNRTTLELAETLARLAGVPQVAVGFAGLKDRDALTTQHFTVQLPGRQAPDWRLLEDDDLSVLEVHRHHRKIRRGALRGNRFRLRLSAITGERASVEERLRQMVLRGVPNYFGRQRFGHAGQNLPRAARLLAGAGRRPGREQRGLLLSAARAHLFNLVLQERVASACWDRPLAGDVMLLAGSQRQFAYDAADPGIAPRLELLDLHPSGPLCGREGHALRPQGQALELEQAVLADWVPWVEGLQRMGLEADRRALRLALADPSWHWEDDALCLSFGLEAGAYATAVVREIMRERD